MPSLSLQALFRKYGIRPKKRLGQHFLTARPTIEKIVASLELSPDDDVIEIGPGPGIMTGLLAAACRRVIAVDRDPAMLAIAREELAGHANITWVEGDILEQRIEELAAVGGARGSRLTVAGNLPYNISSPILFWMLDDRSCIAKAVILVQKEVALRIVAPPGGKDYGILSVLTQAVAQAKRLFDVSAASFVPPPEVVSSVVRLDFTAAPRVSADLEPRFREIVRKAFGQRRKTIRNALLGAHALQLEPGTLDAALAASGIDPRRRPETVSVEEFVVLSGHLDGGTRAAR